MCVTEEPSNYGRPSQMIAVLSVNLQPFQSVANIQYGLQHCPDDASSIISDCGDSVS